LAEAFTRSTWQVRIDGEELPLELAHELLLRGGLLADRRHGRFSQDDVVVGSLRAATPSKINAIAIGV